MAESNEEQPIFSAVSSSARQLFLLLRCISFASKTQIQISDEGLRFTVEDSSVMEGTVFLEAPLFTTYQYTAPTPASPRSDAEETHHPIFEISLPSLLETLQIFGASAESKPNPFHKDSFTSHAFSNQVLGVSGMCRLGYESPGSPLTIVLKEQGIRTTCELVTYEPSSTVEIPFGREKIALKVIMRASYFYDAIVELSANNPQIITISANAKLFALAASSPLGSAVVDFHRDTKSSHKSTAPAVTDDDDTTPKTGLLETFVLGDPPFSQSYKFSHIVASKKALQAATKVSVRADEQGVLSLQFMIENLEGGGVSFVDFRFVPLVAEEGDGEVDERMSKDGTEDEEE